MANKAGLLLLVILTAWATVVAVRWAESVREARESYLRSCAILEAVSARETAWDIARRQGGDPRRTLWQMEQLNPGKDMGRLQVGDVILVPGR
jgi:hypothetical protein